MGYASDQLHASRWEPRGNIDAALAQVAVEPAQFSWAELSASATLVVTPSGGPIRTIVTGRRHITTGSYASVKAGRPCPFEGMNERAFLMHCEVDTEVIDYRSQPFRFEFVVDGKKRTYIADCVRLLTGEQLEVVEVKKDLRAFKDPDYSLKIDCVAEICRQLGWQFRLVFEDDLFLPRTRFRAIEEIQSWRLTAYDEADVYCVMRGLENAGVERLGSLAEMLAPSQLGRAKLKAMMVHRLVAIDLASPLSDDSAVRLIAPQQEGGR